MDPLDVLSDDHATLEAQVKHVAALLAAMRSDALASASVHVEFVQQAESLRDQILEHFGYEEDGVFPALVDCVPPEEEAIRSLADAHDVIAGAISQVVNLARRAEGQSVLERLSPIAEAYQRFQQAFARHTLREADLFERIASMLTPEQRERIRERGRRPN